MGFKPDEVFCFKYYRTVGLDNVVRFEGHRLQIMPTNGRPSYARARVEVRERLDGSIAVYYQRCCLAIKPAPPEAPVLRARNTTRLVPNMFGSSNELVVSTQKAPRPKSARRIKPGLDHPWRRSLKVHINRG